MEETVPFAGSHVRHVALLYAGSVLFPTGGRADSMAENSVNERRVKNHDKCRNVETFI